jgi:hypothetical protein
VGLALAELDFLRAMKKIKPTSSVLLPEPIDRLVSNVNAEGPERWPDGLLAEVTKAVPQRALEKERIAHLGYEEGDPAGRGSRNPRAVVVSSTSHAQQMPRMSYSIRSPEIALAMTNCWICSVPSKMS